MLYQFDSSTDALREAISITEKNLPDLLPIHFFLKNQLEHAFPPVTAKLYAYPKDQPQLWFIARKHHHTQPFIHIATTTSDRVKLDDFEKLCMEFISEIPDLFQQSYLVLAEAYLANVFHRKLNEIRSIKAAVTQKPLEAYLYYMDKNTQDQLMKKSIELPEGYDFVNDVNNAEYTEVINKTWSQAIESDLEYTRAKLQHLPSVVVLHQEQPVAFEMCDPCGFANHLFTRPEHRRQGLGILVPLVGSNSLANTAGLIDKMVTVKEAEIERAIALLYHFEKAIVEGAGAVSLAALLGDQLPELVGKRVVCVLSGGNMDVNAHKEALRQAAMSGLVRD